MANQKGTGTTWNLPNYAGDLFTADPTNAPILSMIGGLTGGVQTENFEFPTDSQYSLPEAAQPAITETASLTAPEAEEIVRTQNTNVTQIFHEKVSISYVKESNRGRMSGLNTAGQQNNVQTTEKDWQIVRESLELVQGLELAEKDFEAVSGRSPGSWKRSPATLSTPLSMACTRRQPTQAWQTRPVAFWRCVPGMVGLRSLRAVKS